MGIVKKKNLYQREFLKTYIELDLSYLLAFDQLIPLSLPTPAVYIMH